MSVGEYEVFTTLTFDNVILSPSFIAWRGAAIHYHTFTYLQTTTSTFQLRLHPVSEKVKRMARQRGWGKNQGEPSPLTDIKNVVTLRLDQKKCIGCGMCLDVCPQAVLSLTNATIEIANRDSCMECGACARNCPADALDVRTGVGCATAVINAMLGRKKSSCCCVVDLEEKSSDFSESFSDAERPNCC